VPTYQDGGRVIEALGDPTRRAIFESLVTSPKSVRELADALPVSRPAVSQHLKALKEAGLVIEEPVGTRRIYRVNTDGVGRLRADVDRFWSSALAAYKTLVEAPNQQEVS
jgi:DNA-binding transcriptional ArsR family regulator